MSLTEKAKDDWKIDVWAMDSDQMKEDYKKFEDLKNKINEKNRMIIFRKKEC